MNQDAIAKAAEIVRENSAHGSETGFGMCILSLIDEQGFPTASIVTPSRSDGIRWITFGTMLDQNRAKRAANCKRASVCFGTAEHCVNLVGDIEIITSDDAKRETWYEGLGHHFTGPDDPNYCVLKFTTRRYKFFLDYEEVAGTL
ncbi:MAG: pyridoxamine 5'-phosphate oxidase family protein [Betaproteobacteria bacterium]|nr:pyridoxamine 5'-phosphate oxidase family protein [Betaproteobacteria bacterium]